MYEWYQLTAKHQLVSERYEFKYSDRGCQRF